MTANHTAACCAKLTAALLVALVLLGPAPALGYNPLIGDFTKDQPTDIRLVSYNTKQRFIADPAYDAHYQRILTVLEPDVLVLQEMPKGVATSDITIRMNAILPLPISSWQVYSGKSDGWTRPVLCSRFPLNLTRNDTVPQASTRGVTIARIDLPDAQYTRDIYVLGVHLKAYEDEESQQSRQRSADAIAAWLGDARQSGGYVTLAADTPMIVMGDFNLVGGPQPETTLLTGDIIDEATFGADVKGDWDISDITDLIPAEPFTGQTRTYPSYYTNPTGRLDRFMYTDSVTTVSHSFILNTRKMTAAARTACGLLIDDTAEASDHLPIAMDVRLFTPEIPTITNVTSTAPNNTYKTGAVLNIQVAFSTTVNVTGTPQLQLETGTTDEPINYTSGSGSNILTFTYIVRAGNTTADLDYVSSTALALNGGTIQNVTGQNATLTLPAPGAAGSLGANKNIAIDGIAPAIIAATSRKTHGSAGSFDTNLLGSIAVEDRGGGPTMMLVTFSEPVQFAGGMSLNDVSLSNGSVDSLAIAGNQLTIQCSGVTDRTNLSVGFPGITDLPGNVVAGSLCFGVLLGDVASSGSVQPDRVVNIYDLIAVKGQLDKPVTAANFRNDPTTAGNGNPDGLINIYDLIAIKANLDKTLAPCP